MPPVAEFSWRVLLTLLTIFALALGTFAALVRQWTSGVTETAMREWARVNGFRRGPRDRPPEVLAATGLQMAVERHYVRGPTALLRVRARGPGGAAERPWHLLIETTDAPAEPVGLRPTREPRESSDELPTAPSASAIDWFGLPTFARLSAGRRFEVVGRDARAAAKLADGPARALLPADVGLLRLRDHLLLDFSARPFDPIELNRVLAVEAQVSGKSHI